MNPIQCKNCGTNLVPGEITVCLDCLVTPETTTTYTKSQTSEYYEPGYCPDCGTDIEFSPKDYHQIPNKKSNAPQLLVDFLCEECNNEWTETYELKSATIMEKTWKTLYPYREDKGK